MFDRTLLARVVALVVLAGAVLAGCAKPPDTTSAPPMESPAAVENTAAAGGGATTVIQAKGSDTLLQVAQALAEAYKAAHPDVEVSVTGGGSGTGFQALIEGTTDIADSSRKIKDEEMKACQAKGIEPVEHIIGYDGIAVIVNKANPIAKLAIDQLSDLYTAQITDWKALGGKGEVTLCSRDSTSGTYEYFKEHVVQKGDKKSTRDFAPSVVRLQSTTQIREQVASTEGAIGYIGLGYVDDSVKVVPIVGKDGKPVAASAAAVRDGSYPISRPLFMYTKKDSPEAVTSFVEWIKGAEGQKIVEKEGFVSLAQ